MSKKQNLYHTLFDLAHDPILILEDEQFVAANRKAADLLGCPQEDLVGQELSAFLAETSVDLQAKLAAATSGEPQQFSAAYRGRNGDVFAAQTCLQAVSANGKAWLQVHLQPQMQSVEDVFPLLDNAGDFVALFTPTGQ